jgi:two-component system, sensor histidine kinase and response regulator
MLAQREATRTPTAPIRTLIVDDVADLRRLYRLVLESSGRFEIVGEADDGDAAVAVAAQVQPALVTLDVSMPRRDGMEALPDILAVAPDARVVMVTGFEAGRLEGMARARGAVGFLEKGLAPDELVQALLVLAGHDEVDPAEAPLAEVAVLRPRPPAAPPEPLRPEDVVASVAHELRNPLTAAIGMADTLALRGEDLDGAGRRDLASRIAAQCRHLGRVVDAVLQIGQADHGGLEVDTGPLDLDVVLPLIVADLRVEHRGVYVDLDVEPGIPEVVADVDRLRQVLASLVANAVAHGDAGTPVRIVARAAGRWVDVVVADRGPGVPADQRERVFDRFVRLGDGGGGLGLGLPVARALTEAMGGSIRFTDATGGAQVVVTLPAAR